MSPRNRGKKAREKREIATRELSAEERAAMLDALVKPPLAISCAIIGALTVEQELEVSIKSRLRRISQTEWEAILSDKEGPLGTFDRKIKFASYLGILDADMRCNLDIIRNIRNRFAHTKRLISFDHHFIADEMAKVKTLQGQKRHFARLPSYDAQWRYVLMCLHCIRVMSKKRFGNRTAAHKAWMKRHNQRMMKTSASYGMMGGILGALAPPFTADSLSPPISTLAHQTQKTASDPNKPTPLGLLSGLLPYLEVKKPTPR
jgi:hypothetical protein